MKSIVMRLKGVEAGLKPNIYCKQKFFVGKFIRALDARPVRPCLRLILRYVLLARAFGSKYVAL